MKWLDNLIIKLILARITKKVEHMNWQWIHDQLVQPSTWKGIIRLVTAALLGIGIKVHLSVEEVSGIVGVCITLTGLIDTFRNEKKAGAIAADAAVQKVLEPASDGGTAIILRSPKDDGK